MWIVLTQSKIFGCDIRTRLVILDKPGNAYYSIYKLDQQNSYKSKGTRVRCSLSGSTWKNI